MKKILKAANGNVLITGNPGTGKTEFSHSVLDQKFYSRAVIHQEKKDEYITQKQDMLFNPYSEKGYVWDFMSESEETKKMFLNAMNDENVNELLKLMAHKMQNPKQKSFVLKDFFAKKNQTKLILCNESEHRQTLISLFSAFIACMNHVQISMQDTKTDITLYVLEDFLNLINEMNEQSQNNLFKLRAKGGILIPIMQYMPKDKKIQQLLTGSAYTWIYFSNYDANTRKMLEDSIGGEKVNELFKEMGAFEHITYISDEQAAYTSCKKQVWL